MSSRCPFCSHQNPSAAARCEKCQAWLTQSADVGSTAASSPQAPAAAGDTRATLDAGFIAELLQFVQAGQKIEAIRRLREATGSSLVEAKDAIEALEVGRQVALLGGTPPPPASDAEREILDLVRGGNKIAAIKLHRERTGTGLKEAKDAVETLARAHGINTPQGVGCGGVLTMLLLGLVVTVVVGGGFVVIGKWAALRVLGM